MTRSLSNGSSQNEKTGSIFPERSSNRQFIQFTTSPAAISGVEVVVFAVPSGALREVALQASLSLSTTALVISRMPRNLEEEYRPANKPGAPGQTMPGVGPRRVALSGRPGGRDCSGRANSQCGSVIQSDVRGQGWPEAVSTGSHPTFRVYTGSDVVGVEIGGAIKNSIAIGAGILEGLGYGDNSRAALMTRGLAEAVRLGVSEGAQMSTFLGLSGVGDLIVTGGSRLSRNYRVGYALGKGGALEGVLAEIGQVAEGVPTTRALCDLAARCNVRNTALCRALRHSV